MQTTLGQVNASSVFFFIIFITFTLLITYWAAKRTKTAKQYYAAGRSVTGFQNGLALSGDYMSAASFLGIAGMVSLKGYDGMIYATGWLVGWPALMFLIAEPLRNLGKYTFADVVAYRLNQKPIRIAAAIGGILVLLTYTIGQMVGAGNLIKLMFGLPYEVAELIVGCVMLMYVLFGGMLATTWVQIIKACLLLGGVTVLMLIGLSKFGFNPGELYGAIEKQYTATMLNPGGLITSPLDAVSLGLALMLGLLGLPHILMRFYTVPDAKAARKSVIWATTFIGYFYCIIPIVGFTAAALMGKEIIKKIDAGGNMAAPLLAEFVGGTAFMGFIAAVAFATILAVVAGLTLAAASAMSHDLFVNVIKGGKAEEAEQVKIARMATIIFGIAAILLGIAFKGQNVAYMVGLTFAIACSGNFPALLLSIVWKRFTTKGAVWAIIIGSVSATLFITLSPTVWVEVLKNPKAIFPLRNPAIVSMTLAFAVGIILSLIAPDKAAEAKFEEEKLRTYLGVGAE
ncbi:MAG: sodium/solute symporter [Desulfobacteraceae bacterium]|nr:sodium/solute symporter [Desulfobacteraceae bacterium]